MRERAEQAGPLTRRETARRLQREGLPAQVREPEAGRRFSVAVLDLEAADIRRMLPGRRDARTALPDDRLRRIVTRAAVRALYVLGLDVGQVMVDTDERGRASIAGVLPELRPGPGEGEARCALAAAARTARLAAEKEAGGVSAMLGADPEFVLQEPGGKIVPASRFLPTGGLAGCDSIVRRGVKLWPLVELRPDPSGEPAEVAEAIRRLMAEVARRLGREPLVWRAGAWPAPGLPLGGHVHISGAVLTGERLRALDNAVALPLRLLEPPGVSGRRPKYGALGDFRRQPHGGFEYRTPPSWLVSRRLSLGVLALAKIAVEHAEALAPGRPLDDDRLRDAFYGQGEESLLRDAALRFYEAVRRTEGYRRYAADVDFVFEAVQAGRHWDETADIRPKWGIRG